MKKLLIFGSILLSATVLAGCGSATTKPVTSDTSEISSSSKPSYKYFISGNVVHESSKGTVTINKAVVAAVNGKKIIFLDETVKNTSSEAASVNELAGLMITASQKNTDGSQIVTLNDQSTPSDAYDISSDTATAETTNQYNLANEIVDRQTNKLTAGSSVHLLAEFGYTLDNESNDVKLELSDQQNDDTVNPKKNSMTLKIDKVLASPLNLKEY